MTVPKPSLAWNRKTLLALLRLLGALLLAGLATHSLRSRHVPVDTILFLAAAVTLFLWTMMDRGEPPEATLAPFPEEGPLARRQWLAVGLGLLLGALSWPAFAGNRLRPVGLLLLAGAIATIVLASWPGRRTAAPSRPVDLLDPRLRYLALLGIVLLGAFFRLYRLDLLPGDMFNDLAHNFEETERVLHGDWMIYATGFPGREPLAFYLAALLARVAGLSYLTLKLTTALVGIATVPVVYLLGREGYNDATGLVAALFVAVAKWPVLTNRVGFRGSLTPLTTALALYFLLRAIRRGRRGDFLWAGAWVAVGLYGYTAALATIPALLLGLGLYAVAGHGRDLWRARRSLLLAILVALLVALPMLRYMLVDGRQVFWSRPATRVSAAERPLPGPAWKLLLGNLGRTAGMFHVQGDPIFRANVPGDPHLDVVAGTFFLLGFPLLLARWRRGGNALVLSTFAVMLLPTTLSLAFPQEVPGAVRSGGAIATAMLFPAAAVVASWRRVGQVVPALQSRWGWSALLVALALVSAPYNAHLCFVVYPRTLPAADYPLYRQIARAIDDLGDDGAVLLKDVPYWSDKDAIRLQTRQHHDWGLHGEAILAETPWDAEAIRAMGPQVAIIFHPNDQATRQFLQQQFPQGVEVVYRDDAGTPQFAVYIFQTARRPP